MIPGSIDRRTGPVISTSLSAVFAACKNNPSLLSLAAKAAIFSVAFTKTDPVRGASRSESTEKTIVVKATPK